MIPMIPTALEKPPTLYSILESIVNFDTEEKAKIRNLAKQGRNKIFDFDYDLSDKISKEKFECQILNHFLMRRIGFDTLTAFKIQLEVKLNEIMPKYNMMFNMLDGWDIFKDGETITREVQDSKHSNNVTSSINESETENTNETESHTTGNNTSDMRSSDTPQNELEDVRSGEYVDRYDYRQDNSSSNDTSESSATSSNNSTSNVNSESHDSGNLTETTTRTQNDKLNLYLEFTEKTQNIYSLIFKDLECLFYQLI